jgi:hypothetical protein
MNAELTFTEWVLAIASVSFLTTFHALSRVLSQIGT